MKKKIFSSLLLVAFAFAATSMITSCKDYDDDINDLRSLINNNKSALEQAKTALEGEISSLKTQLGQAEGRITTLENTLKAEQDKVKDLQSRMSTAEGNISTLQSEMSTAKSNIATLQTQMSQALSDIDNLKTRIGQAETALTKLNELIGTGKIEPYKTFTEAVTDLYARMVAVEGKLGTALEDITELQDTLGKVKGIVYDLESQVEVLNGYKSRVEAIEADYLKQADKQELLDSIDSILSQLKTLRTSISTNAGNIAKNAGDIKNLKEVVLPEMDKKINTLNARLNVLNVWLTTQLRSLVFEPQFYYWGIEAAKFLSLDYFKYTVDETAYNKKESKGYEKDLASKEAYLEPGDRTDHERYESVAGQRILDFTAYYFMNPSTAKVEKGKAQVSVIFDDKEYMNTRATDYNMWVADWNTETPGKLAVKFDMTNKQNVKQVLRDHQVSVFATQVKYTDEAGNDTTITSDFAAMYVDSIQGLRLAHTAKGYEFDKAKQIYSFTGVTNAHCGGDDGMFLMATVAEAAGLGDPKVEADAPFAAQDSCDWDKTMDLNQLVEVRYTDAAGKAGVMSVKQMEDYGLSVSFELTGLYYGDNKTSESAHAALLDGSIFKPQSVNPADGSQSDATEANRANLIGRTPLVRVLLKDTEGNVLDYGYIRIRISETKKDSPLDPDKIFKTYTGSTIEYTRPWCAEDNPDGFKLQTLWYQTEYDMYTALGLTKEEFDATYEADMANSEFTQFEMVEGKFQERKAYVGHAVETLDPGNAESATLTWTVSSADIVKLVINANPRPEKLSTVIRYKQKENAKRDDLKKYLYIELTSGAITIVDPQNPTAVISWEGRKNANYWYALNSQVERSGLDEIHVNVYAVEDEKAKDAKDLLNLLAQNFTDTKTATGGANTIVNLSDKADMNAFAVVTDPNSGKDYKPVKGEDLTFALKFADENKNNKEYVGVDGKTYVTVLSEDALTLQAYDKADNTKTVQDIAKLEYDGQTQDINHTKIVYQSTDYAKALLNYHAHNNIEGTLIAYIDVLAKRGECVVPTTCDPLKVRFLRPINAYNSDKEVEDASTDKMQVIDLWDLVNLTDWRDAWKGENPGGSYYKYYGITGISIEGVEDGEVISQNENVMTTMNSADPSTPTGEWVKLNTVTNLLDFIYKESDPAKDGHPTLTYKNNSGNVQKFDVKFDVRIDYIWGYILTKDVQIHVNKTHANAKQN